MKIDELSDKDVYLARLLSQLLIGLLDSVAGGYSIVINDQLNTTYLRLCDALDKLAESKFERPFESLYAAYEDIDIEWNEGGVKKQMLNFYGWLDSLFVKYGKIRFPIKNSYDKEIVILILNTYALLKSYKQYKSILEANFKDDLQELLKTDPKNNLSTNIGSRAMPSTFALQATQ